MHIFTVILTVIATIAAIVQAAPATTCSTPKVRQEWRKLTQAQHSAFLSAIDKLKNRPASSPVSNSLSGMAQWNYDQFVKTHWDSQAIGHGLVCCSYLGFRIYGSLRSVLTEFVFNALARILAMASAFYCRI